MSRKNRKLMKQIRNSTATPETAAFWKAHAENVAHAEETRRAFLANNGRSDLLGASYGGPGGD